jgi:sugar phosphate isomerase/epimerase
MTAVTHIDDFGMDTVSLAGPLAAKLAAMRGAGFKRVMLAAGDLVALPGGFEAAVRDVRDSALAVTGLRVLRSFEGLDAPAHDYKVDVARSMIEMCAALGCRVLLASSSTDPHASGDHEHIARDLRKLAMMAIPFGIRVAYESVSWGRHVNSISTAWQVVQRADCPNLGLGLDSYHSFAGGTPLEALADVDIERVFLVQLSDFLWRSVNTTEERIATAEHFRVFPGQGAHSGELQRLVLELDRLGYRGSYSFAVFNSDYLQLPLATVAERARRAAVWLAEDVLRRAVPLPHQLLLPRGGELA